MNALPGLFICRCVASPVDSLRGPSTASSCRGCGAAPPIAEKLNCTIRVSVATFEMRLIETSHPSCYHVHTKGKEGNPHGTQNHQSRRLVW